MTQRFHCFLLIYKKLIYFPARLPTQCLGLSAGHLPGLTHWPPSPQAREVSRGGDSALPALSEPRAAGGFRPASDLGLRVRPPRQLTGPPADTPVRAGPGSAQAFSAKRRRQRCSQLWVLYPAPTPAEPPLREGQDPAARPFRPSACSTASEGAPLRPGGSLLTTPRVHLRLLFGIAVFKAAPGSTALLWRLGRVSDLC